MYESYKDGSILSLKLENFQTYKHIELFFHPSLNFIAGPNGSGKSSIANAIALIFCGNTSSIGKTKNISEYVNFNSMEAKIEVQIKRKDKIYFLKRVLKRDTKKTNFYINNVLKKENEYCEFVSGLGIDIDNLCMFLPQEKVSEFSSLSSEELLIHALNSQPDKSILATIDKLNSFKSEKIKLNSDILQVKKTKEGITEIVANLCKDAEKLKEKNILEEKIKNIRIKKKWLNYELISEEYKNIKSKITEYKKTIEEKEKEVNKIEEKIKEFNELKESKKLNEEKIQIKNMNNEIYQSLALIKNQIKKTELLEIDKKGLENKKDNRKSELENLKNKIIETEKKISSIKIEEIRKNISNIKEIDELNEKLLDLEMHKSRLEYECKEMQFKADKLDRKKKEHGQEEHRRMEYLEKYHPDTFKAVEWLRRNKHLFIDEIIEPAILSLKIKDNRYIKEVETFLSFQILSSFICKNKEDFEKFVKILKEKKKLGINVLEKFKDKKRNILSKEELKSLGFDVMLIDLIEDKEEIIDMLNVCGHFYAIPVTKGTIDEEKVFLKYENIKRMAARNKYIEIKRSLYNKSDYVLCEIFLKSINLLSPHTTEDVSVILEEIKSLENIRNIKHKEFSKIMHEMEELKEVLEKKKIKLNEQNELANEMERRKNQREFLIKSVENYKVQIQSLEDFSDLEKEKEQIIEKITFEKEKITEFIKGLNETFKCQPIYANLLTIKKLEKKIVEKNNKTNLERNKKLQIEEEIRLLRNCQEEFKASRNDKCKELDKLKESLKKYPITDVLKNKFSELPQCLSELDDLASHFIAKLEFYDCDPQSAKDYKEKEKELQKIVHELNKLENKSEMIEGKTNNLKNEVINKIQSFIAPLNQKFSLLFKEFNCEGKINFEHECLESTDWKLNILVKFRENSRLELLTSYRQSGGEKSLTTILFLLALQSVSPAPFRLVDEINQGMDKYNEKLVHNTLVSLCKLDSSQFFIITPKIVPGLEFSENMKVHIVFSGNFEEKNSSFVNYKIKYLGE